MNTQDTTAEFEKSLARAQSSLVSRNAQEFRAAVQDLQKLVERDGRWQGAVNFLVRSIDATPVITPIPIRTAGFRD